MVFVVFFFFKQKTAYEISVRDWSSDVCSSDLPIDIWPALDWTRLPGITVEQKPDTANDFFDYGTRSFVGGTGDGLNGVSAMDYAPLQSSVTAKKAWFFFENTIVFLTNSISSRSINHVESIIDQRPMTSMLVTGNNWAVANGVGYW